MSSHCPDSPWVPIPAAALKLQIRNFILHLWTKEWQSSPGAQHTIHFYYIPNPHKAKYVYKLARLELGRLIRLVTGHNNLNGFQYRIGLGPTSCCRFCGDDTESFLHVLHSCPCFWQSRRDIFIDQQPSSNMEWSVRDLLEFSYIPTLNEAFEGSWAHADPPNIDALQSDSDAPTSDSASL